MGDQGASNMGDRRPRCVCPGCGRSIAVTFNHRSGRAVVRSHVTNPGVKGSQPCYMSRRELPPSPVLT